MTERATAAHLLRRLTFGPTAAEVDAAERAGLAATLTELLAPIGATVRLPAIGPDPLAGLGRDTSREDRQQARRQARTQAAAATRWWLARLAGEAGAAEKLTFF